MRDPSPVRLLTDLVALARYALEQTALLEPLAPEVERRFDLWLGREKNAGRDYSAEQTAWLHLLRDAVSANAEVLPAELRGQPQFQARGGMGRARRLFGAHRLEGLLEELSAHLMPGSAAWGAMEGSKDMETLAPGWGRRGLMSSARSSAVSRLMPDAAVLG